ncbi:hypothetical protein ACQKWADRAFT_331275 [Trichoderma austrokoningii]
MTVTTTIMSRIRSQRCQRCRWRKIKCDENWPTCSPCARARHPCSGPPILIDHDSDAASIASIDSVGAPSASGSSSQVLSHHGLPEGSSFIRMRLAVGSPRAPPTTIADRVACRLIGFLDKGSAFDATLAADYLRLIPRRLGLQRALDDETQNFACETLAAATIMERLTLLFDNRQSAEPIAHVRGIQSLMVHRGPPNPEDELDVALAFANLPTLMTFWLSEGGENFHLSPPWRDRLTPLAEIGAAETPRALTETYNMVARIGKWPSVLFEVRDLIKTPDEANMAGAHAMLSQLDIYQPMVDHFRNQTLDELSASVLITESLDPNRLGGTIYNFSNPDLLNRVLLYLAASITANRQQHQFATLVGAPDIVQIDRESLTLCATVWKCIPYIRSLGPISAIIYQAPLVMSLEGGDAGERISIIKTLRELDKFLGRLPRSTSGMEKVLLERVKLWTGQEVMPILTDYLDERIEEAEEMESE